MSSFDFYFEGEPQTVEYRDKTHQGVLEVEGKIYRRGKDWIEVDGRRVPFWTSRGQKEAWVWLDGIVYQFELENQRRRSGSVSGQGAQGGLVTAQMPGKILRLEVEKGQQVEAGDSLLVMESMKMELSVAAPVAGQVSQLWVESDQQVQKGDRLVEVTPS